MDTYRIRVIPFSASIRAATVITDRRSHFRERKGLLFDVFNFLKSYVTFIGFLLLL